MIIPQDSLNPRDVQQEVGIELYGGIIIPYCHAENTIANTLLFQGSCGCFSLKMTILMIPKYSSDQNISSAIFTSPPIHGTHIYTTVSYSTEIIYS